MNNEELIMLCIDALEDKAKTEMEKAVRAGREGDYSSKRYHTDNFNEIAKAIERLELERYNV